MIIKPGTVMYEFIYGKRKTYQSPVTYLFMGIFCYTLFINHVIDAKKLYIGVLLSLGKYKLVLLMVGLAVIGWLVSGIPDYTFYDVVVIFCYTYGTSFLVTPFFILAQEPFIEEIKAFPTILRYVVSDLPSAVLIFYILASFYVVAKINWWRYILNAILGYCYYLFFIQKLL
jgi:hypothetical protein